MEHLKGKINRYLDEQAGKFIELGELLYHTPELGYREFHTSRVVAEHFKSLGLPYEEGLALTGVKARLKGKNSQARVAVLAELDAVYCPEHPDSDKTTGAAHACGHHMQVVALLACAEALTCTGVGEVLDGDVIFFATPAEEYVEYEHRSHLLTSGKIHFLGGKQELLYLGCFNDVDLALATHASVSGTPASLAVSSNGFGAYRFKYKGRSAHVAVDPSQGVNALNAALISMVGMHALRETFPEREYIRVSFILKEGGRVVNTVPAEAVLEIQIRGRTLEAISQIKDGVRRAVQGGAMVVGCGLEEEWLGGYMPYQAHPALSELLGHNASSLLNLSKIPEEGHGYFSTDLGDLSQVMPVAQIAVGGFKGGFHALDFTVADKYLSYLIPAKILCHTIIDLLERGAAKAREIKESFIPRFEKSQYREVSQKIWSLSSYLQKH